MTVAQPPRSDGGSRLTFWAWLATGLAPVAFALATVLGFANEGDKSTFVGRLALTLGVLAVPAIAFVLGVLAAHAHLRSGRSAEFVAGLLLVASAVLLPLLVIEFGTAWLSALIVVAVVALVAMGTFWSRVERLRS